MNFRCFLIAGWLLKIFLAHTVPTSARPDATPLIDGAQAHDAAKSSPSLSTKSVKTRVV